MPDNLPRVVPGCEPFSAPGGPHGALVIHGFTGNPHSMRGLADYREVMSKSVFQTGISWRVVESKWPGIQDAFRRFEPAALATLTPDDLRAVHVAWTLALPAIAAINTTEVFLAKDSFGAGDFGYGLLFGSIGLGLAVGGLAAGTIVEQRPIGVVYGSAILVNAIAFGLAAVAPNIWIAAGCCALGGIGNGATVVCNSLLVQRGAPDELRGRAFTVIMSINVSPRFTVSLTSRG